MDRSVHVSHAHIAVDRPKISPWVDALDTLKQLRLPQVREWRAPAGPARVVSFVVDEEHPLGPLAYSADTTVLFAYTARFGSGALATLLVSGECVDLESCQTALRPQLEAIHDRARWHQGIVEHQGTFIRTPHTFTLRGFQAFHISQNTICQTLRTPVGEQSDPLPTLDLSQITLRGWSTRSLRLPTCTFTSAVRRSQINLLLDVRWSPREGDVARINLTTPRGARRL